MRSTFTFRLLLVGLFFWLNGPAVLRAQMLDATFQPTVLKTPIASLLQSGVNALAVQPDGKILTAGGFDFVNGAMVGKLQRLNADGTTDATFNVGGTGANGFLSSIVLQPDGKILVGGGFTTFNGQALAMVVRLNANGSLDPGFIFATANSTRQISSIALQPDGKILVGSGNSQPSATNPQIGGLVRLLPNGALDASFNIGTGITQGGLVSAILVQADGNIVVGGSFVDFNGQNLPLLVRLTPSGAFDPTFIYNTPNTAYYVGGTISALLQQPDGKLLAAGNFGLSVAAPSVRITRFLSDGTIDNTFQTGTGPNSSVRSMARDPSGNIIIGGAFTQVNGINRNRLARLTSTGALDVNYGDPAGASSTVNAVALTPGGQAVVGGAFAQYNTVANTAGLVRLNATTGLLDNAFAPAIEARGTFNQAVPLASGQLLVNGNFTQLNGFAVPGTNASVRRLNANGTLDPSFASQATATGLIQAVQPNGSFYLLATQLSTPTAPSFLQRLLGTGAVDNGFTAALFGPTTGSVLNWAQPQGAIAQSSGRLLVFGRFTSYGSLTGLSGLVRLNADGTPDNSFTPAAGTATRRVLQVLTQPSGKLLVVSDDTNSPGTTLVRLNADGTADNTFTVGTAAGTGAIYSVLVQPDGRLLVSGGFTSFNGQATPYGLTRLTVDGAADPTFSGLTSNYSVFAVQPDGRLVASRNFANPLRAASELVRLNPDGSLDTGFAPVAIPQSIFNGDDVVIGVAFQPIDGKMLLYGSFRYIAGQVRIGLARLTNIGLATKAATLLLPLMLYPNPAHATVTIEMPASAATRSATLLDLSGRTVRRWTVSARQAENQINLQGVAAGVYLLQVRAEDALYQEKLVVAP
ncbi:putative delta-60 repeat protein [Hymenobacter sp. UYAg731]